MAEMNRINSFKSFSEIKSVEKTNKLREENQAKRKQLSQKFESLLDELGITSYEGLDEETKKSFLSKLLGEEAKDKQNIEEGNAFIFAAAKAKQEGKDSFEFNGKNYKVTLKKDTGLKESYNLLITEATRSQFGKIDKSGKITSVYVHNDGYPSHMVPVIKGYKAKDVDAILNLGKAGISFLDKKIGDKHDFNKPEKGWTIFYGRDRNETGDVTNKASIKNIEEYLKDVANDAGAEYVYLYDERDGKWYGADTYTDKALKPVDQIEESVVTEAKAWEIGKDYPSYGVVVGIRQNGDLCEVSFDSGNKIVFRDNGGEWVQESKVTESHFKVGDKVKMSHGGTGVIVSLDKEDGAEDEKYYNVELPNGEIHKHSPNELTNEAAMDIKFDPEMTKDYENVLSFAKKYGIPVAVAMATVASMGIAASIALFKKGAKEVKAWINSKNESVVTESHFKIGDKVKCKASGKTGEVVKLDKEDGADDEKYYTVKVDGEGEMKYSPNELVKESVNEGAVKQFETDMADMIKNIKSGYGWIDPEYVADTWENSSDSIDFELVKGEIYSRLIKAGLLSYADEESEETAGKKVKSLKELGIKESLVNEGKDDFIAWHSGTNITLKKGYKHHTEDELTDLYDKIGELVKDDLKVKNVTIVFESLVNEAEIKSDDEFQEYAFAVLKKAFGDDFDEEKGQEIVDGILSKSDGDYGAAVGMLTSSLGESVVTEAKEFSFIFNYNTDEDDVAYIQNILKKAGVNATAEAGLDSEEMEVKAANAIELRKAKKAIEADGFEINEAIDTKYWEDYHEGASKIKNPGGMQLQQIVSGCVEDWNDNNENGADNEVTPAGEKKVLKLAKEFVKATGWISDDVIDAMIAQES